MLNWNPSAFLAMLERLPRTGRNVSFQWACSCFSALQVIVCLSIAFLLHRFVGFAMVALLVEVNSVFLHLRTILLMAGLAHTTCYRLNSLINLGTCIVFRIGNLAWMTRWLMLNWENIPSAAYVASAVGIASMTLMNIILFYRLLCCDFFHSSQCGEEEEEEGERETHLVLQSMEKRK